MTKTEIATRVAQALEDEGLIHFTSTDLSDSIQDGYALVVLLTEAIEKVEQISIPANSQVFDISSLLPDYYRAFALYSETLRRWLSPRSFLNIKQYGERWAKDTGNIRDWCPLGDRHILFYPSPIATQTLQLFYRAEPDTLSEGDSPVFFEDCHKVLEYYACSDLLDQNLEYSKSAAYFEKFMEEVDVIRDRLNRRGLKSIILELACKSTVTPISAT